MADPNPSQYFLHDYRVYKGATASTYDVGTTFGGGYTIQDYTDPGSTADNLTQLGDIPTDHFHATSATTGSVFDAVYLGKTSGGGVVASEGGNYYLYTNGSYMPNQQTVPTSNAAYDIVCFASGTLIRTVRGEVPVERLEVGDLVETYGAHRPLRWIGHRTIDFHHRPRSHDAMPIRISAHAFGNRLPQRDLLLSPGHPVLVGADEDGAGGHLVPIMCLINGTTIERAEVDKITYWHVELDKHDILLADGLPAESYIDLGSRPWFDGADGALYDPDMALPGMPGRCRPVAIDGPVVEAERQRLDGVFAARLASAARWPEQHGLSLTF